MIMIAFHLPDKQQFRINDAKYYESEVESSKNSTITKMIVI